MGIAGTLQSLISGNGAITEVGGGLGKMQRLFGSRGVAKETMSLMKEAGLLRSMAFYVRQIKMNIQSGGKLAGAPFKKLSPITIKIKGSTKPLLDTGDMMGSVVPVYIDENAGFVGLKRGDVHKKGGDVADIAEIHEFGALVKNHEVPARPFIGPVNKKFQDEAGEQYLKGMEKAFNGR